MKTGSWFRIPLVLLVVIFFSYEINAEDRSYTKILRDSNDIPIIKFTCEYIGKKPIGEFNRKLDWRKKDTDFYNITWQNLTNNEIEFIKFRYYYKLPDTGERHTLDKDGNPIVVKIPKTGTIWTKNNKNWKRPILEPHEEWSRKNLFYSSGKGAGIVYFEHTIQYLKKQFQFTVYRAHNPEQLNNK